MAQDNKDKISKLYKTFVSEGYDMESEAEFRKNLADPKKRKAVYDALVEDGYDMEAYDLFEQNVGYGQPAAQPQESASTQQKTATPAEQAKGEILTDAERAAMLADTNALLAKSKAGMEKTQQQIEYSKRKAAEPLRMPKVELGNVADEDKASLTWRKDVVKGKEQFDPESGAMKSTYTTEAGNEYDNRAMADFEQKQIDEAKERELRPIESRLRDLYAERDRINARMAELGSEEDRKNDTFLHEMASGMNVTGGLGYEAEVNRQRNTNAEYQRWQAAADQNEKAIRDLEAVRDKESAGVMRGLADTFNKDNWDSGFSRANTAAALAFLARDMQDGNAVDEAGETLLRSTMTSDEAAAINDKEMEDGYRWAKIGGQSLPFMVDIFTTGGFRGLSNLGTKMGTKAAEKFATRALTKQLMKYTGTAVGDIAASYAIGNTAQAMKTGADITSRHIGMVNVDDDGNFVFEGGENLGKAFIKGENAAMVENYTEKIGEHLPGLGEALSKGLGKLGLKGASEWLTKVGEKDFVKAANSWLDKFGVQGFGGEVLEEEINIPLNALLVGDNKMSDLVDWDTQKDILGGMALSVGAMKGAALGISATGKALSSAAYHRSKRKMENADALAAFRLTKEKWDSVARAYRRC